MTFYNESRFTKEFFIEDGDVVHDLNNSPAVYWVFQFHNEDVEKIQGTLSANHIISFTIPDGFFSIERLGPLVHQLLIKDGDGVPTLYTEPKDDVLIKGGPSLAELSLG